MTDQVRWEWRYALGIIGLCYNAAVVGWLLGYGDSANLIHQNALSWSYIFSGIIFGGLGFGEIAERVLPLLKPK